MPNDKTTIKPETVIISSFPTLLGAIMANERKKLKFTQKDMADSLEINTSSWSRIERGETTINIEQLVLISKKLGIKASELIEKTEKKEAYLEEEGVKFVDKKEYSSLGGVGKAAIGGSAAALIGGIASSPIPLVLGIAAISRLFKDEDDKKS